MPSGHVLPALVQFQPWQRPGMVSTLTLSLLLSQCGWACCHHPVTYDGSSVAEPWCKLMFAWPAGPVLDQRILPGSVCTCNLRLQVLCHHPRSVCAHKAVA